MPRASRAICLAFLAASYLAASTVDAQGDPGEPTPQALHRMAEHCTKHLAPRACDFPDGRVYQALASVYGLMPEDQAGALLRAWALDNPAKRERAIRRAIAGRGY